MVLVIMGQVNYENFHNCEMLSHNYGVIGHNYEIARNS